MSHSSIKNRMTKFRPRASRIYCGHFEWPSMIIPDTVVAPEVSAKALGLSLRLLGPLAASQGRRRLPAVPTNRCRRECPRLKKLEIFRFRLPERHRLVTAPWSARAATKSGGEVGCGPRGREERPRTLSDALVLPACPE